MANRKVNVPGRRNGNLVIIGDGDIRPYNKLLRVRCDCGTEFQITTSGFVHTKTCKKCSGRILSERAAERRKTHPNKGRTKPSRLYRMWTNMGTRCNNPNNRAYHRYGGRGIRICDEWHSFKQFEKWALSNGYREGLTIDRIDNDKGYSPDNCRFVTYRENNQNRGNNRNVTYNGVTKCVTQWARELGIGQTVLCYRLNHWSVEEAFTRPIDYRKTGRKRGTESRNKTTSTSD